MPNTRIIPLDDRILVRRDKSETQTSSGLYIPDTAQATSQRGEVLALGTGKPLENGERQSFTVSVGDRVVFLAGGCTTIGGKDEQDVVLMRESAVSAILRLED